MQFKKKLKRNIFAKNYSKNEKLIRWMRCKDINHKVKKHKVKLKLKNR